MHYLLVQKKPNQLRFHLTSTSQVFRMWVSSTAMSREGDPHHVEEHRQGDSLNKDKERDKAEDEDETVPSSIPRCKFSLG